MLKCWIDVLPMLIQSICYLEWIVINTIAIFYNYIHSRPLITWWDTLRFFVSYGNLWVQIWSLTCFCHSCCTIIQLYWVILSKIQLYFAILVDENMFEFICWPICLKDAKLVCVKLYKFIFIVQPINLWNHLVSTHYQVMASMCTKVVTYWLWVSFVGYILTFILPLGLLC